MGITRVNGIFVADETINARPSFGIISRKMRLEIVNQALLAHILNNRLRSVIGALVFVFFEQIFENVAEHFRVDAYFAIIGIVFIDGEVVLAKKFE